jgi:hypothetical protein
LAALSALPQLSLLLRREGHPCNEQVAVLHNKAFPSDLTKIKAGKGALRHFITTRRRQLRNGSQGAFKLKYDLRVQ